MNTPLSKDQRAALVQALHALPQAMQVLPQWLVWSYVKKAGASKLAKMPYYTNGHLRGWPRGKPRDGVATEAQPQAEQGHELDRAALVTFEQALQTLQRGGARYDGIGFAFLPGDGLVGIDIDGAITEDGEISRRARAVLAMCPSYTELSVSGRGLHIICTGEIAAKFKSDRIGLEVYAGSQFFTCTGQRWSGTPEQAEPLDAEAEVAMRAMCEAANEEARREREAAKAAEQAARQAAAGPAAESPRPPRQEGPAQPAGQGGPGEKGADFRLVNDRALQQLGAWVPALLPGATPWRDGYRVTSKALGRNLQEDLQIVPAGIMDFGEEEAKSPIDLVVQWRGLSPYEALQWLAGQLGVVLATRRPARPAGRVHLAAVPMHRPEPPPEGEPAAAGPGERPEPPPLPTEGETAGAHAGEGEGGEDGPASKPKRKAKRKAAADEPELKWVNVERLLSNFRYQYGSEVAWDCERREAIKIGHLRHTFGSAEVRYWLASDKRRQIYAEDVMFEPGQQLPEHQLNLFAGLPTEPEPGDCSVMVELLRHLCSTSEAPGLGPEEIADWVLRWCALPLQQLGAKMDTALVFHGPQGTGKNLFFDVLRDLYGEYGVMVGQTELEDKYNTWLSGRMFIIGDEVVSRQEMYHSKNRLKWIVTQETKIPIRAMHQDTRWESNHANLVFLSNESQPLALEDGDRRYLVVYTPTAERGDLYARVREFLKAGGARRFLHFLQAMDLQDFNRHTKPPLTTAKQTLIELGYKPAERFAAEWRQGYLALPARVCSVEQLYRCFRRWADASGERFPPPQVAFTEQVRRYFRERVELDAKGARLDPWNDVRPIAVPDDSAATGRRQWRCWVPRGCAPPDGQTWGAWAKEAVEEFDAVERAFMRHRRHEDVAGDGEV